MNNGKSICHRSFMLFSYGCSGHSVRKICPDSQNGFLGQLCRTTGFPSLVSALINSVLNIFDMWPRMKMLHVDASAIISTRTVVTYLKPIRDFPMLQNPSNSMGEHAFGSNIERAISASVFCSSPQQTKAGLFYPKPKVSFKSIIEPKAGQFWIWVRQQNFRFKQKMVWSDAKNFVASSDNRHTFRNWSVMKQITYSMCAHTQRLWGSIARHPSISVGACATNPRPAGICFGNLAPKSFWSICGKSLRGEVFGRNFNRHIKSNVFAVLARYRLQPYRAFFNSIPSLKGVN